MAGVSVSGGRGLEVLLCARPRFGRVGQLSAPWAGLDL